MAKRAWTDGPWTPKERLTPRGDWRADWLILNSNGNDIAVLIDGTPEDACLIAAAPELYDALREAMLYLPDFADDDQHAIFEACEIARAALKKAEG